MFVQGKPPRDLRKRYLDAVRLRKFTPLSPEDEASEAIGWCVIERPFDLDFEPDRIFYDRFLQLGLRVDKWKIPGPILRSQVADEEQRMLSRKSRDKLTRAEKDEIKLRVIGRLRRKILPTSRAFDVLWDLDAGTVLLFTHSARTTEEFMALFQSTFGLELLVDSPHAAAGRAQLAPALVRAFEKVEPLSFSAGRKGKEALAKGKPVPEPRVEAPQDEAGDEEQDDLIERIESTRFLGAELLLWVWLRAELLSEPVALGELGEAEVWLDRKLTLEHVLDKQERVAVRGAQPSGSTEAREAVRSMKMPVASRLLLRIGERDFALDFNAPRFLIGAGAVPALLKEEGDDAFLERTELIAQLTSLLDALFAAFLRERLTASWTKAWQPTLMAWVEGESIPASALKEIAAAPRAAAYMVLAALLFAVMSVMVKLLSSSLPNAMVVFLRSGLSLLVLLPAMLRRGPAALHTRHLREHIVRGAVGMAAMYCFFFVIAKLGLAEALLLNYSLPLFIPLVERAWLGEPTPRGAWKPLAIGLGGLLLILKPGLALFQPAGLIGVLGALLAATAQVGVRRLTRTESVTKIVFYFSITSTSLACLPALLAWRTPEASSAPYLLALVASGTVAQLLMTRAYQLAPAAQVGPFIYSSVAFAALLDWLVFSHHPDGLSALGTLLVVAAGILALRSGRRANAVSLTLSPPAR